ncbi:MAG: hypothetical protein EXR71_10835 [Myxococcales bacterium]|nr:hypothetical protein [Myxococcales bacterium]
MTAWLTSGGNFDGGQLVWSGEVWVVVVVATLVVIALWLGTRPGPLAGRVGELTALALAGLGLVLLAARPTWLAEGERTEPGRVVVLVDASRSMGVTEPVGQTRLALAREVLARLPDAERFHFGGDLRPGEAVTADLGATDIAAALQALSRRYAGETLGGIVLVTDGIDRGGLFRIEADGSRRLDPSALLELPGPLTVVQIGEDRAVPDVAIVDVRAGAFAFLRAPFTIEVDLVRTAVELDATTVSLTRNGQPTGTRRATFDEAGRGRVSFPVTPDAPGRFIYEVSVPAPPDDAVPGNNSMSRAIRVVRDRVRVLQVCGSPSMDQKFLRLFLKEDPGVDLVSFFILRTMVDMGSDYMPQELSLIEFPYRRLFADDLATFDLVILQNFDYEPYFDRDSARLLENLAEYVQNGGALAFLGGDRSFDLGRYATTPLADVLPVELGVPGENVDLAPFAPTLTAAGARHPLTRLAADPVENEALWARLPVLDGTNLSLGPAKDAAVLLAHPSLTTASGPLPILAVRQVGLGRTMALSVDSSWRWSFAEAGLGGGNQAYLRFWKSAMRWLVGDPDDQAVTIEVARENVEPGEVQKAVVRVRDAGFAPLTGATVLGEVLGPAGRTPLSLPTDSQGLATIEVPTAQRGAHRIKVRAVSAAGLQLGAAETVYAVVTRDPELERIAPDSEALRALATATGGLYIAPGTWQEPLYDKAAARVVRERRESPLWSAPLLGVFVAAVASVGWWWRRRGGRR